MDGDYALGPYRRGKLSSGKLGKLFARLKLGLIGPSTSLRVEQSSSFGLGLGLIGFVLNGVCCSLFVVRWHKPLFLLYLCLYYPF